MYQNPSYYFWYLVQDQVFGTYFQRFLFGRLIKPFAVRIREVKGGVTNQSLAYCGSISDQNQNLYRSYGELHSHTETQRHKKYKHAVKKVQIKTAEILYYI